MSGQGRGGGEVEFDDEVGLVDGGEQFCAEGLGEASAEGESEAGVGFGVCACVVGAPEAIEDAGCLGVGEAATGVADAEGPRGFVWVGADFDASVGRGVAQGIVEEVAGDEAEDFGVGFDAGAGGAAPEHIEGAGVGVGFEALPGFPEEFARIQGVGGDTELTAFGAGHGEEIFDEGAHLAGDGVATEEGGSIGGLIAGASEADVEGCLEAGEWGAEFVSDIGGEGAFAFEGGGEAVEEGIDGGDDGLEFAGSVGEIDAAGEVGGVKGGELCGEAIGDTQEVTDEDGEEEGGDEDGGGAEEGEQDGNVAEGVPEGGIVTGDDDGDARGEGIATFKVGNVQGYGAEGEVVGKCQGRVVESEEFRGGREVRIAEVGGTEGEVGGCMNFKIGVSEGGVEQCILVDGEAVVIDIDDGGEGGGVVVETGVELGKEGVTDLEVEGEGEGALNDGHGEGGEEDEPGAERS